MTRLRAYWNDRNGTNIAASFGLFFLSLIFVVAPASAFAETKNVKIMLDWVIQGTHAPFFIAQDKGYYKAEGVTVDTIEPDAARQTSPSPWQAAPINSVGSTCPRWCGSTRKIPLRH
jgi:NMT1/THI5 like